MTLEQLLAAVNERLKAAQQPGMSPEELVDFMYRSVLQMRCIKAEAEIAAARAAAKAQLQTAETDAQTKQSQNDARRALIAAE